MSIEVLSELPAGFTGVSNEMLAAILDQSVDCIKVIGAHGTVEYMNRNGQCAMEIDDFSTVAGAVWTELWPEPARPAMEQAMAKARGGEPARFEGFCPTAKGAPRWWDVSVSPLRRADGSIDGFIATSRDITENVSVAALREAAADEMRHRLRNTYAVVAGLLSAHAKGRPEQPFVRDMIGRLNALSVAQTMKADGSQTFRLDVLVPMLIEPYQTPDCAIAIGALPERELAQAEVDALALVLGELAVNSTKHGALGAHGRVEVTGAIEDGAMILRWSERSSRVVGDHQRDGGQGMRLMNRVLAAHGGSIAIDWANDGLDATVTLGRQ